MPTYYHNAENALKRANEFCELGKYDEALECMYDALKNRKHMIMKQIHESIINKFLEVCIELKKNQMAKDGLYCYRNICQNVNIKSWEDSVRKYLQLAECKVESAEKAFQSVILEVDDLDQGVTPEVLLRAVSSEDAQDRTERIILLPWIKFLWECHRNCLDLLRSNHTNKLYHTVAQNAFKFCVKFSRRSELRKLCNILKTHSMHMQKRQAYLKADDDEFHLMYLDTGFVELESAINMELWQDAFIAIENIHSVISVSKKFQNSRNMAHYYDKISCVLWKGEEYLFHAAAILRYFQIVKDQKKNLSADYITKLGCRVFLSIIAIPLPPLNPTIDLVFEIDAFIIDKKNHSLSSLLDLYKCPTRTSLLKDALRLGIIQCLPKEFQDLFEAMECEIQSTKIHVYISAVTDYIQKFDCDSEKYMPLIERVAVVKLLPMLFNIYTNIKISKILHFTGISDACDLEIILVDSARRYGFPLRIDHKNMCVHFSSDFNIFQNTNICNEKEMTNVLSDVNLKYLIYTQCALKRAVEQIHPERAKNENKEIAENIANRYLRKKDTYRKNLLHRKTIIEKYKECKENLRQQKEEEERKRLADKLLQYEVAEKKRLLRETEERNLQRHQREQEEIRRKILSEKMETFKKTFLGNRIVENLRLDDLENLDPENLFYKQIEELNRERKELYLKFRRQERNFNHMEKAKRIEEIPLLTEQYDANKKNDIVMWKVYQRNKLETALKKRDIDLQKKSRFLHMKKDLEKFLIRVKEKSLDAYNQEMAKFMRTLEEEKQMRLKKGAKNRKQERKIECDKQQDFNKDKGKQIESNKQDSCIIWDIKTKTNCNIVKDNIKNQNTKSTAFPQKTSSNCRESELAFTEDLKSNDRINSFNADARRRKDISTKIPDGTNLSKDTYYYKRIYKPRIEGMKQTELYDQRASFSQFSSESHTKYKRENYRSDSYSTNDHGRCIVLEKSDASILSRRTSTSTCDNFRSFPGTNRKQRFNKDDATPQRSVTILQRRDIKSNMLKVDQDIKNYTAEFQKELKTKERSVAERSCTPWAKLKRKEPHK